VGTGRGKGGSDPDWQDKIRAFHPTRYIQDESAFMLGGEECLNSVLPTGEFIICISTARAGWFADQISL